MVSEEELIIPDPTKGKKAIAAVLKMKSKKKYVVTFHIPR